MKGNRIEFIQNIESKRGSRSEKGIATEGRCFRTLFSSDFESVLPSRRYHFGISTTKGRNPKIPLSRGIVFFPFATLPTLLGIQHAFDGIIYAGNDKIFESRSILWSTKRATIFLGRSSISTNRSIPDGESYYN
jgi:hypothetical protein